MSKLYGMYAHTRDHVDKFDESRDTRKNDRMWRSVDIRVSQYDATLSMPYICIDRAVWDSGETKYHYYPLNSRRLWAISRLLDLSDKFSIK